MGNECSSESLHYCSIDECAQTNCSIHNFTYCNIDECSQQKPCSIHTKRLNWRTRCLIGSCDNVTEKCNECNKYVCLKHNGYCFCSHILKFKNSNPFQKNSNNTKSRKCRGWRGPHLHQETAYKCEDCGLYQCKNCLYEDDEDEIAWQKRIKDKVFLCMKCYMRNWKYSRIEKW